MLESHLFHFLDITVKQNLGVQGKLIESACSAGDVGSTPGWEDLLEKEMATHSSILAWEISTVHGVPKESDTTQGVNDNHHNHLV